MSEAPPEKPLAQALAPFGVRPFRFQTAGDLATSWAFEMETLILGWYILVGTGDVFMVAMFGALQFAGTLLSPLFGVAGDRLGPRTMMCGMRVIYLVLALCILMLAATGKLTPWVALVIAGLCGLVRPSDLIMRNALIGQILPSQRLVAALSISRTTGDTARIFGALAGAGIVTWLGIAKAYVIVAAFYALGVVSTLQVEAGNASGRAMLKTVTPSTTPLGDLAAGVGYVLRAPRLLAMIWMAFLVNLAAFPVTNGLMPYMAKEVYRADQTWLGYMLATYATGALAGSIGLGLAGHRARMERVVFVNAVLWFLLLAVLSGQTGLGFAIGLLFVIGFVQSLVMVPIFVVLLDGTDPQFRSRVMGVRMLAIYGLPMGLLAAGWLVSRVGFAATQAGYAVCGLCATALIAWWFWRDLWGAPQMPLAQELERVAAEQA